MNRYPLPHDLFTKLYKVWLYNADTIMIFDSTDWNDGFSDHFQQAGWDMIWNNAAVTYSIPEEQAPFFLLTHGP